QAPFREVGRQAAARLYALLRRRQAPLRTVLAPIRVVTRTSTDVFMVADRGVRRAQAFIESRRGGHVLVRDAARAAGVTTVTLGKRFTRHLQVSPSGYILHRRLAYAHELLRAGELNVGEVAATCDFGNCSYFCGIFRRQYGATPGAIRLRKAH
ncbi:MAG: helix-turn-helix domain-containing protein, partial [Kiritimatiellae bacterium]|nr:helix-turn-helix domain-containing protein [Kiritimatiellia bacterium]